jgi:choloylglycine hydrolase
MLGVGISPDDFPLFFDAVNEKGLFGAALNFKGFAKYQEAKAGKINLAPDELIAYILTHCKNCDEAETLLREINLIPLPYNDKFELSYLHFSFSDKEKTLVAEPLENGLSVKINKTEVLTNNPDFDKMSFNLNSFVHLSPNNPDINLSENLSLQAYSKGLGAIGLPGDYSSVSRFIRAVFIKENYPKDEGYMPIFNILSSVSVPKGSVKTSDGSLFYTRYTAVYDLSTPTLFYKDEYEYKISKFCF